MWRMSHIVKFSRIRPRRRNIALLDVDGDGWDLRSAAIGQQLCPCVG